MEEFLRDIVLDWLKTNLYEGLPPEGWREDHANLIEKIENRLGDERSGYGKGCIDCKKEVVDPEDKLCHSCYHTSCADGECYCESEGVYRNWADYQVFDASQ